MKSANDLTQGVIWKQLVKYSLPLIATSVMQSLYSLFDILIAGRFLGSAGISGINNSSQVLGIVNTVSILQVLCKYKIVQKNLFKWTELNSVRFYVIRKISTCQ